MLAFIGRDSERRDGSGVSFARRGSVSEQVLPSARYSSVVVSRLARWIAWLEMCMKLLWMFLEELLAIVEQLWRV